MYFIIVCFKLSRQLCQWFRKKLNIYFFTKIILWRKNWNKFLRNGSFHFHNSCFFHSRIFFLSTFSFSFILIHSFISFLFAFCQFKGVSVCASVCVIIPFVKLSLSMEITAFSRQVKVLMVFSVTCYRSWHASKENVILIYENGEDGKAICVIPKDIIMNWKKSIDWMNSNPGRRSNFQTDNSYTTTLLSKCIWIKLSAYYIRYIQMS